MFSEKYYVYEVYRERNFTKAAKNLYISQPALSLMVKKAEQKIGASLFNRDTNPISLTDAGQYYIEQAEKIMVIEHEAAEHFAGSSLSAKNCLRIGGSSYFVTYVLTGAVNEFKKTHPDLEVQWAESKNQLLLQSLDADELDLYIEVDDISRPGINKLKLGEETVLLAVPSSYDINEKLADCRMTAEDVAQKKHLGPDFKSVKLNLFKDYPFILLREGNDSHERALKMCTNSGFVPKNIPILADQVMTSFYLSTEEYGISFIRDSILFHGNNTHKLYFYRPDDSLSKRNIYLYYSSMRTLPAVVSEFIDFMKDYTL